MCCFYSEVAMRVVSLVFAVITSALALPAVHAQTAEKTKPAAEANVKPATVAKPAAPSKAPASDANKSKVDGVSTQRSAPADMKKNYDDCHSKGSNASDA
jgi:hypothetical protein